MNRKIYYLIPDIHNKKFNIKQFVLALINLDVFAYFRSLGTNTKKAVGGVKVMLQHIQMLRANGFEATAVKMGSYEGNVYGYDIDYINKKNAKKIIGNDDIVVATEFSPYDAFAFETEHKVLFMQNILLRERLEDKDKHLNYIQLGFKDVFTCSDFCTKFLQDEMGIKATTITNGVDTLAFSANTNVRKKNQILMLPRKNPEDGRRIKEAIAAAGFLVVEADGLSQKELILKYQESDIFAATGYPEGFGLPPLEAMLCGCVVVGFTGGGADEFMIHNKTGLVAPDGDSTAVAKHILTLSKDESLKELLRENGNHIANKYTLERTESMLVAYFERLMH